MTEQDHYCQDDGTGKCIICQKPMPVKEQDHYCQDDGTGKCIICQKPM